MGLPVRGSDPVASGPLNVAERHPLLTIGMPVYNGQQFLDQTIESLLTQTCSDFGLIISDNGSNDRTEQICRDREETDPRIRYIRHPSKRGAAFNWNFVATEATGELFNWASDNDVL